MSKSCVPPMSQWHTYAPGSQCSGVRGNPSSYSVAAHSGGEFHISPYCPRGKLDGYIIQFSTVDGGRRHQSGKLVGGLWHNAGRARSPAQAATMIKNFCAVNDLKGAGLGRARRKRR